MTEQPSFGSRDLRALFAQALKPNTHTLSAIPQQPPAAQGINRVAAGTTLTSCRNPGQRGNDGTHARSQRVGALLSHVFPPRRRAATQGAYSAAAQKDAAGCAHPAARGRAVALTILEGGLCAALQPLTLLLPAATGLFVLREVCFT